MFEYVRHKRSLFLLLSLTDPGILKQSIQRPRNKNYNELAFEKVHRQKCLKEYFVLHLLEYYLLFNK